MGRPGVVASSSMAPSRSSRGRLASAAGALVVVVAVTADATGLSSRPGFGGMQLAGTGLGVALVAWGLAQTRPRLRARLRNSFAVAISTVLALWLLELVLAYPLNPRRGFRLPSMSVPGMVEPGERVSFRHAPGFRGMLDDGIVRVPVSINTRGDRDGEPRDDVDPSRRILLVGDSFTFGYGLPPEHTIDARIEARTHGELDAYNLGVMGYGPGDTALRLEESTWWSGRAIYYLFFDNDLQANNAQPGLLVAHRGWVLPRLRPDGQPYTESEWEALIAFTLEHGHPQGDPERFGLTFMLPRLRGVAARAFDRNRRLTGFPDDQYAVEHVDAALAHTERMRAEATARGAAFAVVLLPALGEAIANERSAWSQRYIEGLAARGIDTVDPIESLDADDYFAHDPHFDADGADAVAGVIVEHLRRDG